MATTNYGSVGTYSSVNTVNTRHMLEDKPLTWHGVYDPVCAYGYYGDGLSHMYCKVCRPNHGGDKGRDDYWWFYRSGYHNQGYLLPTRMEGATTMQEAMDVAQVYYFINGWEIIDVHAAKQEYR